MLGTEVQPALRQASQKIFDAYGRDIQFTGCGIGLRQRDGDRTDEPVVIAMVTKKLPAGAVSRSRLLPRTVEAGGRRWGVDVVEVGPLTLAPLRGAADARPEVGGPITGKFRPPLQGCSVSDATGPSGDTGTFGCLVRDTSDGTICVFGSNFVIAQSGLAASGASVVQPGQFDGGTSGDGIATLKRYVPFTASGQNTVDAAIAQLTSQSGYSQNVADNLMKPISAAHPVVGSCIASDAQGLNCFLGRMDLTLAGIGAELLPATPGSPCTVAPQVGMHIEKVGRSSGYTSSTVDALAAQVNVYDSNRKRTLVFADMIWTQAFFLPGDNGAVACEGGNGRTFVPPPKATCPLLASVGHYFDLPLTKDNSLSSQLKNEFLAQSLVGNLLIGLVYDNSQTVINRVKGKQAPGEELGFALSFYDKYRKLVKAALADPGSTKLKVTQGNLNDFVFILSGLSGAGGVPPILKPAETQALDTIYNEVLVHTKGKDFAQMVAYMNEVSVYEKVVKALAKVPTISLTGTVGDYPL